MCGENAKLYLAAADNYEDMGEEQKLRYRSIFQQLLNVFEDFYLMSQVGVQMGDPEDRRLLIHDMLRTHEGRPAWKDIRLTNEASFREVIDSIAEAKGEKDFVW